MTYNIIIFVIIRFVLLISQNTMSCAFGTPVNVNVFLAKQN